jgi:CRP-like cAMP-binding protein
MSQLTPIDLFRHTTDFRTFPAGSVIFKQGDPGECMYVVKQGSVDITVAGRLVETRRDRRDIW